MAADATVAGLKLRAEDADDLAVLSACLQDALVAVRDLAYDPEERLFVLVANRFRWESASGRRPAAPATSGSCARSPSTRCRRCPTAAFAAARTTASCRCWRSDRARRQGWHDADAGGGAVYLEFSGGATIRLDVDRIACRAEDLGEPWPTPWQPRHDAAEVR